MSKDENDADLDEAVDFYTHVFPTEMQAIRRRRYEVHRLVRACQPLSAWHRESVEAPPILDPEADETEVAEDLAEDDSEPELGHGDLAGPGAHPDPPFEALHPSTEHDLVGLALSGGGIRSAIFNLGVLQALHSYSVLLQIDYLSTVSGGGYLGSAVSASMRGERRAFPFMRGRDCKVEPPPGLRDEFDLSSWLDTETPAVKHLRDNSNYLTPGGLTDWVRIVAILCRGILLNWLIVAPWLVLGSVAAYWLVELHSNDLLGSSLVGDFLRSSFGFPLTAVAALLVVVYFVASPLITSRLALAQPKFDATGNKAPDRPGLGGLSDRVIRRVLDRLDGTTDSRVNWMELRTRFERSLAWALILVVAMAALELQPVLIQLWHERGPSLVDPTLGFALETEHLYLLALATFSTLASVFMSRTTDMLGRFGGVLGPALAGGIGLLLPFMFYLIVAEYLVYGPQEKLIALPGELWLLMAIAALGIVGAGLVAIDINQHAVHAFYRDALCRAFLVGMDLDGRIGVEDDLALSETAEAGSIAPYHLINTSLNLQGDPRLSISGRRGDFFLFSKAYIGSARTGYCPTEIFEKADPHIDLGTAMAISAAAASPNMGRFTMGPLVQLMTLFNIRMGYWIPHPDKLRKSYGVAAARLAKGWDGVIKDAGWFRNWMNRARWSPGPDYLLRELRGAMDDQADMVNVSDGGHLENLGVFELLRRRCRYIIVGDGEADPDMHFNAIATLKRFARIDLGIEIDIDLVDLEKDEAGYGVEHATVGLIRYPARPELDLKEELGLLLYIKASLTGDEDELISEYRATSPTFPHESTADQFFDERQFEAYRALGYHMTSNILNRALKPADYLEPAIRREDLRHFFHRLQVLLEPKRPLKPEPAELKARLGRLFERLDAPELEAYVAQIPPYYEGEPTLQPERMEPSYRRAVMSIAQEQLRLMQDVVGALDLIDPELRSHSANSGWMNLFRRWAGAPDFRWAFAALAPTTAQSFRFFCAQSLELELSIVWRRCDGQRLVDSSLQTADEITTMLAAWDPDGLHDQPFARGVWAVRGVETRPAVPAGWAWVEARPDVEPRPERTHGLAAGFEEPRSYVRFITELVDFAYHSTMTAAPSNAELDPRFASWVPLDEVHQEAIRQDG